MAKTQGSAGERNAIGLLAQDHKRVQKLFKDFEKSDHDDEETVRELVETACLELQIHSMLEEEIFYPAVRMHAQGDVEDLLNEAEVEHEAVDELMAKLRELEASDPMYCAYFSVLAEYVRHHVKEEEQELFPKVEGLPNIDLRQIGENMRVRREELFAEMERQDGDGQAAQPAAAGEVATSDAEDEELEDEQEQLDISRTRH